MRFQDIRARRFDKLDATRLRPEGNMNLPGSLIPANNFVSDNISHGSYGALLFDQRWKVRRLEILERDHHKCCNCGSANSLQVHHRQYHYITAEQRFKTPWNYPDNLLISLCEKCHSRGHVLYKVPIIKI
jgi:hypothetical protein